MTAAHVMNDKVLIVTFESTKSAKRFAQQCTDKLGIDDCEHCDRRVKIVDHVDRIDRMAIEVRRHRDVCSVHVDWFLE